MIGRSLGVLFVVSSGFALVACGGKASGPGLGGAVGTGGSDSGSDTPPGGYETPPPTYDTPPPTFDTPPPVYDDPSGGGANVCVQLCNTFANRTCQGQTITAQQLAECPGECETSLFPVGQPCAAEYAAVLSCILRSEFFQDLIDAACEGRELNTDEIDEEELIAQCGAAAEAWEACGGSVDQNPEPGGPRCTPEGDACGDCPNVCRECECVWGQGAAECTADCPPVQ
jgi:hypothetical protein